MSGRGVELLINKLISENNVEFFGKIAEDSIIAIADEIKRQKEFDDLVDKYIEHHEDISGMHIHKDLFLEFAFVLKWFLQRYSVYDGVAHKEKEELIQFLTSFSHERKDDIVSIKGLENLSMKSDKTIKADAKLILSYMRALRRCNNFKEYKRIVG